MGRKRTRAYPIDDELREALARQQAAFREKFGRDPGPEDPIFFDPDAAEPRELDQGEMEEEMVSAMKAAGVGEALIHAFRRTGLLVTEQNRSNLTSEELAEWQAAIEEYETLKKVSN